MSQMTMEKMRRLVEMNTRNRKALATFLNSGVWVIGKDRIQTRRVLIDCLAWIPEAALHTLFSDTRILVLAPETGVTGCVAPIAPEAPPRQVLTIDARIEAMPYAEALAVVQGLLFYAFSKLAIGLFQEAAKRPADSGSFEFSKEDEEFLKSAKVSGSRPS
jgi:hypothetical protein